MRIWMPMAALVLPALLSACPEKKTPAEPESPAAAPASAQAPTPAAADTSGAPKQEEDEDEKGGW